MAKSTQRTKGDEPQQYSSSAVCAALGLPRTTFDAWMLRGYLKLPAGPGTGRARLLDLEAIIRVAVMKVGADFGVSPTLAGNWANVCVMLMRDGVDFQYLHIRMYPGADHETSYLPDDDLMQDPPRAEPVLKLTIDVRQIVSSVIDALRKQAPTSAEDTALEGRATPMKFVMDHFATEAKTARTKFKKNLDSIAAILSPEPPAPSPAPTAKKKRRSRAAAPPTE